MSGMDSLNVFRYACTSAFFMFILIMLMSFWYSRRTTYGLSYNYPRKLLIEM